MGVQSAQVFIWPWKRCMGISMFIWMRAKVCVLFEMSTPRCFWFWHLLCQHQSQHRGIVQFNLSPQIKRYQWEFFKFQVFLTEAKGFGVRACESIKKGVYICDYSGEILNDASTEIRAKRSSDVYLYFRNLLLF
jgi:hypothetical protein